MEYLENSEIKATKRDSERDLEKLGTNLYQRF